MGSNALRVGASIIGLGSAMEMAFRGVRLAADAEVLAASFRVLIGDTQLATKTLQDLENFALVTPFEMPEVVQAAKQMLAFGEEAQNLVPTMNMLGDVAAGLNVPLGDLVYLFGTLKSQGRAFTIDIRQFAMRGIPIYLELAKVLGLVEKGATKLTKEAKAALDKMIETGQIDFDVVEKAFRGMTGEGGKFFNMMEERSKTLSGLFVTMKESIDLSLRKIGQSMIENLRLKDLVLEITAVADRFGEWIGRLSPEVKEGIVAVLALTAVFVGLTTTLAVGAAVLGFFLTPLGGIALGATIVLGLFALWVKKVGGVEAAWKKLQKGAQGLWNWFKGNFPWLIQMITFVADHWGTITEAVEQFWGEVKPVLQALGVFWAVVIGGMFKAVKAFFGVAVYLFKEFWGLVNRLLPDIGERFGLAFTNVKETITLLIFLAAFFVDKFVGGFKYVLLGLNEFRYAFKDVFNWLTDATGDVVKYFGENWKGIFITIMGMAKPFVTNLIAFITDSVENLGDIITGKVSVADIFKKHAATFGKDIGDIAKLPALKLPVIADSKEFTDAQEARKEAAKALQESFDDFKARKLRELFGMDDPQNITDFITGAAEAIVNGFQGVEAGKKVGEQFGSGFMGEIKKEKWDAALFDSAEAKWRMRQYRDGIRDMLKDIGLRRLGLASQKPLPGPGDLLSPPRELNNKTMSSLLGRSIARGVEDFSTSHVFKPIRREMLRVVFPKFDDLKNFQGKPQAVDYPMPGLGLSKLGIGGNALGGIGGMAAQPVIQMQAPPPNRAENDTVRLLTMIHSLLQQRGNGIEIIAGEIS